MRFEHSAGVFVYYKERDKVLYLLLKKENGDYDIPKGHIEKGESAEDAAKRELKEETGLSANIIPFFSVSTHYFFKRNGTTISKTVKFFLSESKTKNVKISWEHKGHGWYEYNEAVEKAKYKDLKEIFPKVRDYVSKYEAIQKLNSEYSKLPNTIKEWKLSRTFVPGEGALDAEIMLVGQAPGENEDKQKRPFVGRSGKLLDKMMERSGIDRKKVYICSVVQFFPPKNRMPSRKEIELCKPFLMRQLEIVNPRYVIMLGSLAASEIIGVGGVRQNHGRIIEKNGRKYLLTFHPAAILRFMENESVMLSDFEKLKQKK